MNKAKRLQNKRKVLELLRYSDQSHRNCLRWGKGETIEHVARKKEVMDWCKANGYECITEARAKDGKGRFDAVILDFALIIEFETNMDKAVFKQKYAKYGVEYVVLPAGDVFECL